MQFSQFGVGLSHDAVHVGDTLLIFGNFAEVLGSLLDLELLLDLPPEVVPELLQLLGQGRVGQVGLDAILHAQLVQQGQTEIVILKIKKKKNGKK